MLQPCIWRLHDIDEFSPIILKSIKSLRLDTWLNRCYKMHCFDVSVPHIICPKWHVDVTLDTSHLSTSLQYLTFMKMSRANIHKTRYVCKGDVVTPHRCNPGDPTPLRYVLYMLSLSFLQSGKAKKPITVVKLLTFTVVRLSTAAYYATRTYHFDT